jgi:hypothetical protein
MSSLSPLVDISKITGLPEDPVATPLVVADSQGSMQGLPLALDLSTAPFFFATASSPK